MFCSRVCRNRSPSDVYCLFKRPKWLEQFKKYCTEHFFGLSFYSRLVIASILLSHTDCYLENQDCNASVNSSCPQPHPPGLLRGICPPCQSRGWGVCKFCAARGLGIRQPQAFDTHAVSYQNTTAQMILLEKLGDWLICQGRETIEEVCKGMFSILCVHFFIAYQTRITGRWSYRRESTVIESNFC